MVQRSGRLYPSSSFYITHHSKLYGIGSYSYLYYILLFSRLTLLRSYSTKMKLGTVHFKNTSLSDLIFKGTSVYLRTPVPKCGGLICLAFCLSGRLSVTRPKFRLDKKSLDQNSGWTKSHWTKVGFMNGQNSVTQCVKLIRTWLQVLAWWQLPVSILEWNQ